MAHSRTPSSVGGKQKVKPRADTPFPLKQLLILCEFLQAFSIARQGQGRLGHNIAASVRISSANTQSSHLLTILQRSLVSPNLSLS